MRDLTALLNSLVNIDREQLLAILGSEWEFAERAVANARQRDWLAASQLASTGEIRSTIRNSPWHTRQMHAVPRNNSVAAFMSPI